jgi:uncharacterized RDD family membrane protein YckC
MGAIDSGLRYCSQCGRPTPPDELAHFGDRLVCTFCKDIYAQQLREGALPAVRFPFAGFWIRLAAYLIDLVILATVDSIIQYAWFGSLISAAPPNIEQNTPPDQIFQALAPMMTALGLVALISTLVSATYWTCFIAALGATPGGMALGLRVIRSNGARVGWGRALGRYFAMTLSGLIFCIGYILAAFDAEKRTLHDMICDTRVIKTRD